uniref:Uncharacterized protein n=1 Tax=Onchocerca volvulus TaxID=6282 RepID=A0A8R1Y2X7_ONCVO
MAEDTFLGCNLKIWMYIVLSITILAASLEIYRTVKNYNVSDEIIDKILYISIPAVLLGSAILGFIATCLDKKFLFCPFLTVVTILIPLFIASIVLFYIRCMTKPDCKDKFINDVRDTTKIVITTLIFVCSITISLCTLSIILKIRIYFDHRETTEQIKYSRKYTLYL